MFLIISNASPEPAVNPLCSTGGDSVCRGGGGEEEAEMVPKDPPSSAPQHRGDPERRRPSPWPVSPPPPRMWATVGQPPARPSAFVPAEAPGTGAPGATPLPAAACLLKAHLEMMTEE